MKAAVYGRSGSPDVVTVDDIAKPVPRDDEVLVRIHAATVGVVDSLARQGAPAYARVHFGLRRPRFAVLGCNFAGQIEAAGPAVTRFAAGDQVFGTTAPRFGAHQARLGFHVSANVFSAPSTMICAVARSRPSRIRPAQAGPDDLDRQIYANVNWLGPAIRQLGTEEQRKRT